MTDVYVLDACALIVLLKEEKGCDIVVDIFRDAVNGNLQLCMNRLNLLEVYYGFFREKGEDYAQNLINNVEQSVIKITEFDKTLFQEAGRLKASYKISLADAILLAQAIILNATVVTADHHELDAIDGREALSFRWIR